MNRVDRRSWPILSSLLIILLIGAQTISLAHAFEHEPDILQDSCAICVGSGQIMSAAMDSGHVDTDLLFTPVLCRYQHYRLVSEFTVAPHQRGPPILL